MPKYEYVCQRCRREHVRLNVPVAERDQQLCACGCLMPMTRLLASPAAQFKGSGWTPRFHGEGRKR